MSYSMPPQQYIHFRSWRCLQAHHRRQDLQEQRLQASEARSILWWHPTSVSTEGTWSRKASRLREVTSLQHFIRLEAVGWRVLFWKHQQKICVSSKQLDANKNQPLKQTETANKNQETKTYQDIPRPQSLPKENIKSHKPLDRFCRAEFPGRQKFLKPHKKHMQLMQSLQRFG